MRKITKRIIGIAVGLLLWGFFSIQEELAFYGIYYLISYGVYEISSFIPFICLFATLIWLIILNKYFRKRLLEKINGLPCSWLFCLCFKQDIFTLKNKNGLL